MNLRPILIALVVTLAATATAQTDLTRDEAAAALHKATAFFRDSVSTEGGYLWQYTDDLARREGEGKADDQCVWVQAPGTPAIGNALISVYERTGDPYYLHVARDAALSLVKGQLQSGGWSYRIYFDTARRAKTAYRADGSTGGNNTSTLDDDNTQSALRMLMRIDEVLQFKDETIHEAALYTLQKLLDAQYPNGAWPQRFTAPPDPAKFPVKKASYPESWRREFPHENYMTFYTFNDNTIADTIRTLFMATDVYGDQRYRQAAEKAGGFILLAQMPDPQPAWAQQYNADMHPAWARKFEPPAVTGGESQGVMRTLIMLYGKTGDEKYLEPIPRALAYFRASALPDGRLARFYELETNKPLYFTKDYQLTYSDADMPTHYSFKSGSSLDSIEAAYKKALASGPDKPGDDSVKPTYTMTPGLMKQARAAVDALDERGAWVEKGRLRYHGDDDPAERIISCRTFMRNVSTLGTFIAASGS
ncbi:MAG: hypothetical protein GY851_23290 [bacterium]|nr:hypothetical protein [bacterium]